MRVPNIRVNIRNEGLEKGSPRSGAEGVAVGACGQGCTGESL